MNCYDKVKARHKAGLERLNEIDDKLGKAYETGEKEDFECELTDITQLETLTKLAELFEDLIKET